MKVLLASPHGFCAGVVRAIDALEGALALYGPPVYVYHEIVHNRHVVQRFQRRGVTFVESLDDVPDNALLLLSAHGVSPQVRAEAQRRLRTIDATCPLVNKVHVEAARLARKGYTIVLIGHAGHDEVVGIMGEAPDRMLLVETPEQAESVTVEDPEHLAYLTQTTLSLEDTNRIVAVLKRRFPSIRGPRTRDICYATQNRQEAVRQLARQAQLVLILGSKNSSNSIRLVEVAEDCGTPARLIDQVQEVDPAWLRGVHTVLVTAGASAPEDLVWECIDWLETNYGAEVAEHRVRDENVGFRLPNLLVELQSGPSAPSATGRSSPSHVVEQSICGD